MQRMTVNPKTLAAEGWFGYGRWSAPYWFVGMEPGGDDEHSSYEAWLELDPEMDGLIDCYDHHMNTQHPSWKRWHAGDRPPIQNTWGPLIRTMLAYLARPVEDDDVSRFQRDEWGRTSGETAVIELSALHARNLGVDIERSLHRDDRIGRIRREMLERRPKFVLFYGTSYRSEYERIAGPFVNGYRWCNSTLCVLVQHPAYRFAPRGDYWVALGKWLCAAVNAGPDGNTNDMPAVRRAEKNATLETEKKTNASSPVQAGEEYHIVRSGAVVGRVLYDGSNLRVERLRNGGGYELLGYYERSRPTTVRRKLIEIDDVFDEWTTYCSGNPEAVKANWRTAPFIANFDPPTNAIRQGCSIVEDDGLEVGRIYKIPPNHAVWKDANS